MNETRERAAREYVRASERLSRFQSDLATLKRRIKPEASTQRIILATETSEKLALRGLELALAEAEADYQKARAALGNT